MLILVLPVVVSNKVSNRIFYLRPKSLVPPTSTHETGRLTSCKQGKNSRHITVLDEKIKVYLLEGTLGNVYEKVYLQIIYLI